MATVIDFDSLFGSLSSASSVPLIKGPGIYLFCVRNRHALPKVIMDENGLLYVGMTEDSLEVRNHFEHKHSGFSTFRRSLGALLKDTLDLVAVPRSAGPSRSNMVNYRFTDEGERILTAWMVSNLLVGQANVHRNVLKCEKELISRLQPPLNLTGWPNPYRKAIKELRSVCVQQAGG